jgi:hypothetical protein
MVHYTFCSVHVRYKHSKYGCHQSIMKGTLLEDQSIFSSVSRFLQEEIPWFVTFVLYTHVY